MTIHRRGDLCRQAQRTMPLIWEYTFTRVTSQRWAHLRHVPARRKQTLAHGTPRARAASGGNFVYLSFGRNGRRGAFVDGDLLPREQCGLTALRGPTIPLLPLALPSPPRHRAVTTPTAPTPHSRARERRRASSTSWRTANEISRESRRNDSRTLQDQRREEEEGEFDRQEGWNSSGGCDLRAPPPPAALSVAWRDNDVPR